MQALFIGGIKSGKSLNAELYTLKNSKAKPIYLATTEFIDDEMQERIEKHKAQRADKFETLQEPLNLLQTIKHTQTTVLVECVSMWINNMLYHGYTQEDMMQEISAIIQLDADIVWVINDVSCNVVSEHKLVREFVDINGRISQLLASNSTEVYNTVAGISVKIK